MKRGTHRFWLVIIAICLAVGTATVIYLSVGIWNPTGELYLSAPSDSFASLDDLEFTVQDLTTGESASLHLGKGRLKPGSYQFAPSSIEGVELTLSGTDDRGNAVNLASLTDEDGIFMFFNLRPGSYSISETQPAGYVDSNEVLGTIDSVITGSIAGNDQFGDLLLSPGSVGINYNFAERPEA